MSIFRFILYAFISSVLFSCRSTTILKADFEDDGLGSPPVRDLPGAPSGDVIEYTPELAPFLTVNTGLTSGRALFFTNGRLLPGHYTFLSFRSTDTDLTNNIWAVYTARSVNPAYALYLNISDQRGNLMVRMRIDSDGQLALARNWDDGGFSDPVGNVGTATHTIIFTLNVARLTYNITLSSSGHPVVKALYKPMITRNALLFSNPAQLTLGFTYSDENGHYNAKQQYVIEEVLITKKIPDIMR